MMRYFSHFPDFPQLYCANCSCDRSIEKGITVSCQDKLYLSVVFSDKYRNARKACKLAEDNSNLDTATGETDLEGPRRKRKTKRLYDSESDDEPSQKMKRKTNRNIYSDSDESIEILDAQKIKQHVRGLLEKTDKSGKKGKITKNLGNATRKFTQLTSFYILR